MLTKEALQPQKEEQAQQKSSKRPRQTDQPTTRTNRSRRLPSPHNYTPLNRLRTYILEHIRSEGYNITELRRLNLELAGQRCRDRYCLFHCDYGHDTEYYQLKEEIERLISALREIS